MNQPTDKLGVALAGGGFRAALFHLGVLRRLAELDLLRHVQAISTVSGGSIIGAVYMLRLKKWLETTSSQLSRDDYVKIVDEVDEILTDGISRNLRTRLLLNPLRTLRIMLTPLSMGRAMAELYEHHIMHEAVMRAANAPRRNASWNQLRGERKQVHDALRLENLRIRPKDVDKSAFAQGIEEYNAKQADDPNGSVLTNWIVNATTLNSGGRFFFSGAELGDWYLGTFRRDEFEELKARRVLLIDTGPDELQQRVAVKAEQVMRDPADTAAATELRQLSLASWWQQHINSGDAPQLDGWEALARYNGTRPLPGELAECALGPLRRAKIAAWYMRHGHERTPPVTGACTPEEHWTTIVTVLGDIDRVLAASIATLKPGDPDARLFAEFILEIYLLRTAERMSDRFDKDWENLSICDAVGASACFPPVFPPFLLLGLYDDAFVTRLSLSDGGAYDNAGFIALLDESCTSVIASDTGGLFDDVSAAPSGHFGLVLRLPPILMHALGGFQRLALRERKRTSRLNDLAYFTISAPAPPVTDPEPLETGIDPDKVARLRTDLDCFCEVEMAALINQGYTTADRFARAFMQRNRSPKWGSAPLEMPRPMAGNERVNRVLTAGSARFLRGLMVRAPVSVFTVIVAVAAMGYGASRGLSVSGIGLAVTHAVSAGLARLGSAAAVLSFIPDRAVPFLWHVLWHPISLGLLALGLSIWLVNTLKPVRPAKQRRKWPWRRTAMKWTTSYAGNVLWLAWALPLLIVIALTSLVALGWLLFYLPWRAAARIKPDEKPAAITSRRSHAGLEGHRRPEFHGR